MAVRYYIKDMQTWASYHDGKCLSKEYFGRDIKLVWRCEKGHVFDLAPVFVSRSAWCPQCTIHDRKVHALELMNEWAENLEGTCLSKKYTNAETPLDWECKNGHQFKRTRRALKRGSWCSVCREKERRMKRLIEMQVIAKSKGGKCLSAEYINLNTKLEWQCKQGHRWKNTPLSVDHNNRWCAYCNDNIHHTIDDMYELAERRRGKCLSKKYINTTTKLKWLCSNGHVWKTMPSNIISGNWCPYCAGKAKHTIEEMKAFAKSRNGKCLSTIYVNNTTKLKWQCAKGHIWKGTPSGVIQGCWCQKCYFNRKKITI